MTPAQLGIIIALLATTLLGMTGALVYRFTQRTSQPTRGGASVTPTRIPSQLAPSFPPDSAVPADWKTYSNGVYKFSFNYPSDWTYREDAPRTDSKLSIYLGPPSVPGGNYTYGLIFLTVREYPLTVDEFIDDQLCEAPGVCPSSQKAFAITIGGVPAKRLINRPLPINSETVVFKNNHHIFILDVHLDDSFKELLSRDQEVAIFNQVLSTFKFTISDPEQLLIDSWLEEQNLNQYGDPKDTMYAGGTPLFDERTGERTDRYDYILKKFPERPWNN